MRKSAPSKKTTPPERKEPDAEFINILKGIPLAMRRFLRDDIKTFVERYEVPFDDDVFSANYGRPRMDVMVDVSWRSTGGPGVMSLEEAAQYARLAPHTLRIYLSRHKGQFTLIRDNKENYGNPDGLTFTRVK